MAKRIKAASRYLMAVFYVGAGLNHFRDPGFYLDILPGWMPLPHEAVLLSGVIEVVLGGLVAIPRTSRTAAWGIVVMLLAFLPVHVHMLMHNHLYPDIPTSFLWLRFPLQGLLILWAFWFTGAPGGESPEGSAGETDRASAAADGRTGAGATSRAPARDSRPSTGGSSLTTSGRRPTNDD